MVFQGSMLLPLRSELQSVGESTLTSRKKMLRLDDTDKLVFFHAHESTKATGWIDKLQQAGFCMTETPQSTIKCFRSSLKAPSKQVIEQLCALAPKAGLHLMSKMQELCIFLESSDTASALQGSESGIQLILNDIHAVVMELDETLLESSAGADDATKSACSDWLKQVQAYVLYLQKQLAALSAGTEAEAGDSWLNLAHEMRVSFQDVVSEVKNSGVTADGACSGAAPSRRARRVMRTSCMPYSHWSKRIAI